MKNSISRIIQKIFLTISFITISFLFSGCELPAILVAGSGKEGHEDGLSYKAKFNSPEGMVVDDKGNLFIADMANNRIRKITPDGNVSTFAGSTQGYADGKGTEAKFTAPIGILIDKSNNLFITESSSKRLRKITPDGNVSTFYESGGVKGIGIDKDNNIYFSEGNIKKITQDKVVSTTKYKPFNVYPPYTVIDSKNNIYYIFLHFVEFLDSYSIFKVSPDGNPIITFISEDKIPPPSSITIDDKDNLYVACENESRNDRDLVTILKITPEGNISIVKQGIFWKYNTIAINNKTHTLYLANTNTNSIYKIQL